MKKAILVVSFGTTYDYTRKVTIGAIESAIKNYFKDYIVERAFTSTVVIKRLRERGTAINNVSEALEKLYKKGIEEVIIQPTHIINGFEYEKISNSIEFFKKNFKNLVISAPLLYNDMDYKTMAEFIDNSFGSYKGTVILMGHGTEHSADYAYTRLQSEIKSNNIFIATVEGSVQLEDAINNIISENVLLSPFMVVCGDHANNDLIEWKNALEERNCRVELCLKGLGEYEQVRNIYISHVKDIISRG